MKIFLATTLSIVMFFLLLYGCATMPREADLKESLRSRAEEYWKLRMHAGLEATYRMEDSVGLPPFDVYRERAMAIKKFNIESHSIADIRVKGDTGEVDVKVDLRMPAVPKALFHDTMYDRWVFKEGKWMHIFRQGL